MGSVKEKKNIAVTVKNLHISYRGLKKTSIRASWRNFGKKIELFEALKTKVNSLLIENPNVDGDDEE